jgi:hypothetical protein
VRRKPVFLADIVVSSGEQLKEQLLAQGLAPSEVLLKYCWPRYAPPKEAGIASMPKSENLRAQFERLVEMHGVAPSGFPMPVGTVRSTNGEFVGYILEYVPGVTLESILAGGMFEEARRQLEAVEATVAKLHTKALAHGDLNPSNIIAADDGRTLLIDPVPHPGGGRLLQDDICLEALRRRIDEAFPAPPAG